ncbi:YWFCY domain-containing protein [Parachryseolinea silvisoli]
MGTGENEQALRKIIDMIRMSSMLILGVHFYVYCHQTLAAWGYTMEFFDKIMLNLHGTGIFNSIWNGKLFALGLLVVSLIGAKGKKDEEINARSTVFYIVFGLSLYLTAHYWLLLSDMTQGAILSFGTTALGYILILTGGTWLSRLIKVKLGKDVFNRENETFPQEERKIENEFSINLPARYTLKGSTRNSYISIINPFRGLIVMGGPGSG